MVFHKAIIDERRLQTIPTKYKAIRNQSTYVSALGPATDSAARAGPRLSETATSLEVMPLPLDLNDNWKLAPGGNAGYCTSKAWSRLETWGTSDSACLLRMWPLMLPRTFTRTFSADRVPTFFTSIC